MKKYFLLSFLIINFLFSEENLSQTFIENKETNNTSEQTKVITDNSTEPLNNLENKNTNEIVNFDSKDINFQSKPIDTTLSSKELDIPQSKFRHKNSFLAIGLSILIPGLGHTYLGDYSTAGIIFGSSVLGIGGLFNSHTSYIGINTFQAASNYGIYAVYRDVRLYNNNVGYSYKMPTDSFKDLATAPFSWKTLKKPEVWGGFLGSLTIGSAITYLENKLKIKPYCKISHKNILPLTAFTTAISEETLFRGFMQPMLSEILTPVGGIIFSSLAFGAAHIPNAKFFDSQYRKNYYIFSIPFITFFGAYFGWMTHKNQSLKESVALHSWYDFTLFAINSVTHSSMIGKPSFRFSFSF